MQIDVDIWDFYFENGVEVDKVLKGRPVEMDHLGVLPGLLGLGALSQELFSTLFEFWVGWLAGDRGD